MSWRAGAPRQAAARLAGAVAITAVAAIAPWATVCAAGPDPAAATAAPTPAPVPLEVTVVATGGYWQQESTGGPVRAVVRTAGFESVASRLTVEWLREPELPGQPGAIAASIDVDQPLGMPAVFNVALRPLRPGCVELRVSGQPTVPAGPKARTIVRSWWALQPGELQPQRRSDGRSNSLPPACRGRALS